MHSTCCLTYDRAASTGPSPSSNRSRLLLLALWCRGRGGGLSWTLLARGASEEEIESQLRDVRQRMMEVGGAEQDARAASKLWEWWNWRFEEPA